MTDVQPILIVEDELITAESIKAFLENEEYEIAGIASIQKDALTYIHAQKAPTVAICDINLKGKMEGIEIAKKLKQELNCEIIFLTAYADTNLLHDATAINPVTYLVKPYTDRQLLVAVQMAFQRIYRRQALIPRQLTLSEREKEILTLISKGMSSAQIAKELFLSVETIKTHRRNMMNKNNINSMSHLVYLYFQ